jgi:hypothetical protein
VIASLLLAGCLRGPVDGFTTQRVVPAALQVPDVDRVCRTGGALGNALVALPRRAPHEALIIADATAALCDDSAYREVALQTAVAAEAATGPARVALVRDGREHARRLRARSALRFASAWAHTQARWDWIGDECGRVGKRDELTFLIGLMSGTLAMLHDKATGSDLEVPLDTLARVGRAGICVDDARWWAVPSMFEAAAWTLVPGSAPEGVDPWEALEDRARRGAETGHVRLGWALAAVLGANAGRDDLVRTAIRESAASFAAHPPPADARLLDAYAHELLQYEADRIAVAEQGHRATGLTVVTPAPSTPTPPPTEDPFAPAEDDPFGDPEPDPFAPEP